jgi:hypothetical protein
MLRVTQNAVEVVRKPTTANMRVTAAQRRFCSSGTRFGTQAGSPSNPARERRAPTEDEIHNPRHTKDKHVPNTTESCQRRNQESLAMSQQRSQYFRRLDA